MSCDCRGFSRLTLNSKLVLVFTGALLLVGALAYYLGEVGNSKTLGELSVVDQITDSLFHSVNRTSGFSTGGFSDTREETNFLYMALMFIGGASASVAGGHKGKHLRHHRLRHAGSVSGTDQDGCLRKAGAGSSDHMGPRHRQHWIHRYLHDGNRSHLLRERLPHRRPAIRDRLRHRNGRVQHRHHG